MYLEGGGEGVAPCNNNDKKKMKRMATSKHPAVLGARAANFVIQQPNDTRPSLPEFVCRARATTSDIIALPQMLPDSTASPPAARARAEKEEEEEPSLAGVQPFAAEIIRTHVREWWRAYHRTRTPLVEIEARKREVEAELANIAVRQQYLTDRHNARPGATEMELAIDVSKEAQRYILWIDLKIRAAESEHAKRHEDDADDTDSDYDKSDDDDAEQNPLPVAKKKKNQKRKRPAEAITGVVTRSATRAPNK